MTLSTFAKVKLLVAALFIAGPGWSDGPPYKFRPPPMLDESASYCGNERVGDPHGNIVVFSGRVLHTCARHAGNRVRTAMNPQRVPGLRYNLMGYSVGMEDYGDDQPQYGAVLERNLERYPDFRDRITMGDGIYAVYHNLNQQVPIEGTDGETIQMGNLYVYEGPVEGAPRRAAHFADCWNENKSRAEGLDYSCWIRVGWHGLTASVNVWAGGDLFTPMEHEHFPALADDVLVLLEEVDVTNDPERQACIRDGYGWREGRCEDGS